MIVLFLYLFREMFESAPENIIGKYITILSVTCIICSLGWQWKLFLTCPNPEECSVFTVSCYTAVFPEYSPWCFINLGTSLSLSMWIAPCKSGPPLIEYEVQYMVLWVVGVSRIVLKYRVWTHVASYLGEAIFQNMFSHLSITCFSIAP